MKSEKKPTKGTPASTIPASSTVKKSVSKKAKAALPQALQTPTAADPVPASSPKDVIKDPAQKANRPSKPAPSKEAPASQTAARSEKATAIPKLTAQGAPAATPTPKTRPINTEEPIPSAAPALAREKSRATSSNKAAAKASPPNPGNPSKAGAQEKAPGSTSTLTPSGKAPAPKTKASTLPPAEKRFNIPPILLEGDLPPPPKVTGPGTRYALGQLAPPPAPTEASRSELPEGYGTRRLFLAARDPHWLYASWDLTLEQQRELNQRSRQGHLILRVFANEAPEIAVPEVHVNPESRTFFINVPQAETRYHAELGIYNRSGKWEAVSKSPSTYTPPDAPAKEAAVEFATIPAHVTFAQVVQTVQQFVSANTPLLEAVIIAQTKQDSEAALASHQESSGERTSSGSNLPLSPAESGPKPAIAEPLPDNGETARDRTENPIPRKSPPEQPSRSNGRANGHARITTAKLPVRIEKAEAWTPEQEQALARLISIDSYRRVWMGSIEITELVRRHLEEEVSSIAAADRLRAPSPEAIGAAEMLGVSSAVTGPAESSRDRKFWFKINAELILYGSTEPDARVTIADRIVRLRPDGTFSFRFALPDGSYDLPAAATSADGAETREALLEFSRSTEYHGHVAPHPQDPGLKAPRPENL